MSSANTRDGYRPLVDEAHDEIGDGEAESVVQRGADRAGPTPPSILAWEWEGGALATSDAERARTG